MNDQQKKKNTIRIVDKSSVNYTFIDNNSILNQSTYEKNKSDNKSKKLRKTSIKDIQIQDRNKVNSKNIKSLQGHSPVYE